MDTQRIASYRREFSALADLQAAGTVTYSLLREADAFVICVQRDEEPPVERMLCDTEEERAGMLTRDPPGYLRMGGGLRWQWH